MAQPVSLFLGIGLCLLPELPKIIQLRKRKFQFQRAGTTEQQVHLATFGHLDCSTIPELDAANCTVEPRVTAREKMLFPFSHRNQPVKLCHSLHEDPV